jgi:hypothetical protein
MSTIPQFSPTLGSTVRIGNNPFDIASTQKAIDDALATLKADEHGVGVATVSPAGFWGSIVIRGPQVGPFKTSAVATFSKPLASSWDWNASGRVSFLVDEPPTPAWFPRLRGWYRFLRGPDGKWNGPLVAALKSIILMGGFSVKLKA